MVSQIPSLSGSESGLQFPHQLLKVPFTSGVEKPESPFMFKRKVTFTARMWVEMESRISEQRNFIGLNVLSKIVIVTDTISILFGKLSLRLKFIAPLYNE